MVFVRVRGLWAPSVPLGSYTYGDQCREQSNVEALTSRQSAKTHNRYLKHFNRLPTELHTIDNYRTVSACSAAQ